MAHSYKEAMRLRQSASLFILMICICSPPLQGCAKVKEMISDMKKNPGAG